ncbi:glycosyltransferase family 4 protein (plasmid) [Pedobacter sp. BS3]|uniref:glycosyltransferase n=1 Tax=Pedobacter sp. BS3 TaxID=2567937 RepID=UPI0011ECA05C|nr:glycosyltransferase [Pedobacter sp. BS3]TZF86450.1 glycosyltransferase family 4 protein [Pedobacter sp. BS3]
MYTIVISAINFFEGGPLSVLKDCLAYLNTQQIIANTRIMALVHSKKLFNEADYSNIEFIEFPKSRKSYLYRLYYEYYYFNKFSSINNVKFWFSLHDITPNIRGIPQAVYCHNPSPFNTLNLKDIVVQPTQFFFRLFYKYLYAINIKKNKYIVVQQQWIKKEFERMFAINNSQIIVSPPQIPIVPETYLQRDEVSAITTFFFPTFPRPFKNIEIICEAVKLLNQGNVVDYKVIITIDGSENNYSKSIIKKYGTEHSLRFIGLVSRDEVYNLYSEIDCLIFPSKLETWGLPISEFKQFNKPIFTVNLPYAKETVGSYDLVKFFDADNTSQLACIMEEFIKKRTLKYDQTGSLKKTEPFAENWDKLFSILLS